MKLLETRFLSCCCDSRQVRGLRGALKHEPMEVSRPSGDSAAGHNRKEFKWATKPANFAPPAGKKKQQRPKAFWDQTYLFKKEKRAKIKFDSKLLLGNLFFTYWLKTDNRMKTNARRSTKNLKVTFKWPSRCKASHLRLMKVKAANLQGGMGAFIKFREGN